MKKKHICVSLCFLLTINILPAQTINDTIFLSNTWRICERPLAAHYRLGTIRVDSLWKYTGAFADYSIEGMVENEGGYSEEGYRDGLFNFYDGRGKIVATGNYKHGRLFGNWEWKYTDGSTRAIIYFPDKGGEFKFLFYRDTVGKVLLENGTGNFAWTTDIFNNTASRVYVYGSFTNGKRTGDWKYYSSEEQKIKYLLCEEKYTDEGELKRAVKYGHRSGIFHNECFRYLFAPLTIRIAEEFAYDDFFNRGPDSLATTNVLNYLLNRRSVDIVIKNKKFEDAMEYILHNLDNYRDQIDYKSKDLEGTIEFKVGDRSLPEDITVNSNNITSEEKQFLLYLMSKFKNIEMPVEGSIGFVGYHTIYFYTIDMRSVLPASVREYSGKELLFSFVPKDKYLLWLNANKTKIKRYIRNEILHYW